LDEPLGNDIYRQMKVKERRSELDATFWFNAPECRRIVLTWMSEVCEDFGWGNDTRHIAIAALDRFVSVENPSEVDRIQLLAGACLYLASKCEVDQMRLRDGAHQSQASWSVSPREMAAVAQTTPEQLCQVECQIMTVLISLLKHILSSGSGLGNCNNFNTRMVPVVLFRVFDSNDIARLPIHNAAVIASHLAHLIAIRIAEWIAS
jgi:hypothetical protein